MRREQPKRIQENELDILWTEKKPDPQRNRARAAARRRKRRRQRRIRLAVCAFLAVLCAAGLTAGVWKLTGLIWGRAGGETAAMRQEERLIRHNDSEKPEIVQDFLTPNEFSRPQEVLPEVTELFVHYTANPGTSAQQNRSYFENLGITGETSASAHFVIGYDGTIIQCLPLTEIGYAVKAVSYTHLTGDVKTLPAGSTPIDFAYSIHTAVGNKMIGARVNGKLVTIDYEIQNGDRVEVLTSQNSKGPSRDWLNVVKSTQAKNKINQWFKHEVKEENILKGKDLFNAYCKARAINLGEIMKPDYQNAVMKKYGFMDWDSVLAAIGHGALKEGQIANRMQELYEKDHPKVISNEEVLAAIAENSAKQTAQMKPRSKNGIVVKRCV